MRLANLMPQRTLRGIILVMADPDEPGLILLGDNQLLIALPVAKGAKFRRPSFETRFL
jgi:hypothetical protein